MLLKKGGSIIRVIRVINGGFRCGLQIMKCRYFHGVFISVGAFFVITRLLEFSTLEISALTKVSRPQAIVNRKSASENVVVWYKTKQMEIMFSNSLTVQSEQEDGSDFALNEPHLSIRKIDQVREAVDAVSALSKELQSQLDASRTERKKEVQRPVLTFHIIMTRFYRNTTILQHRRPPKLYPVMFNFRHRRVIESIFFHHPNAKVFLHTNFMMQEDIKQFTDAGYALIVKPLEFERLAKGTPLEGVTSQPKWKEWEAGPHWYTSFSNLYRLLLLWSEGGIYIDTDVIVTQPFDKFDRVVGFQDPDNKFANNAVLVFKKPGNQFVWRSLVEMEANYSTHLWGQNGPALLTRVWRRWGKSEARDAAVSMLSQRRFFLFLHSDVRRHCFGQNMTSVERRGYAEALAGGQTFAVHLANRLTGGMVGAELKEGTFCHYLLTRFCVFCDEAPPRPPAYPAVEADGVRVALP